MNIALHGLIFGLSLIVAIGPQNALLLKQGIKKEAVAAVVTVCLVSDIILIVASTAGVGAVVDKSPMLLEVLKYGGVVYLSWFAWTCFREAFGRNSVSFVEETLPHGPDGTRGHSPYPVTEQGGTFGEQNPHPTTTRHGTAVAVKEKTQCPAATADWRKPVIAALVMTWLNPGAYVDAVIMIGGMANQYADPGRWWFAAGTLLASCLWFPTIGFGAAKLAGTLSSPKVMRWVNASIGVMMIFVAVRLLLHT